MSCSFFCHCLFKVWIEFSTLSGQTATLHPFQFFLYSSRASIFENIVFNILLSIFLQSFSALGLNSTWYFIATFTNYTIFFHLTSLRISGVRSRKPARRSDYPLQLLDGRRKVPYRQRMVIRRLFFGNIDKPFKKYILNILT